MRYVVVTLVPRPEGWYATLRIASTVPTAKGRPRTADGPFGILLEGARSVSVEDVAAAVRKALEALV